MSNYINFFPGDMREERSIWVSDEAAYGMSADLGALLDSMLRGCTASLPADGIKAALEDGEFLGTIAQEYDISDESLQEVVEELHGEL